MSFMFFFLSCDDFNPTERPIRNYRFCRLCICSRDSRKEIVIVACGYVCNQEQRNDGLTRIISARTTSPWFVKGAHTVKVIRQAKIFKI